jgi:hypothetical protein
MAYTDYNFSKTPVDPGRLRQEIDASLLITIKTIGVSFEAPNLVVTMAGALSTAEEIALGDIVNAHTGAPLNQSIPELVEVVRPNWEKLQLYSYDLTDMTTWYQSATQVTGAVLVQDPTSANIYSLPTGDTPIIDLTHGGLPFQRSLNQAMHPVVMIDGVPLVEHTPDSIWSGSSFGNVMLGDGDYAIDYQTGRVTLKAPTGGVVTMNYFEAGGSLLRIEPPPGMLIELTKAEFQFGLDVSLRDCFVFDYTGVVGQDPRLAMQWDANGGPFPAGTRLPLSLNYYDTVLDLIAEANGALPLLRKTISPNPSWRDIREDIQVFEWLYADQREITLASSYGSRLDMRFENDIPAEGYRAIATLYGRMRPES